MAGKSADEMLNNWVSGMSSGNAQVKYKAGIDRTIAAGVNPMARASTDEALARYRQNTSAAGQPGGKMAVGLAATSPTDWASAAKGIGAQHFADGATKGKRKYAKALQKWKPIYDQVSAEIHAMPKGGAANAKARAGRAIDILMQAAGRM